MTNREWLNSLSNEEFVEWLIGKDAYTYETTSEGNRVLKCNPPYPRFETIKYTYTNSQAYLKQWLDEERKF